MMTTLRVGTIWAIVMVVGLSVFAATAEAGEYGRLRYGYGYPYPADFTTLYESGRIPTPPYFALHPPVYYSYPVPRTYGHGPYAYPPYVKTPEVVEPGPKVIENKFVPKKTAKEASQDRVARAPLRIANPFVVRSEAAAASGTVAAVRPGS